MAGMKTTEKYLDDLVDRAGECVEAAKWTAIHEEGVEILLDNFARYFMDSTSDYDEFELTDRYIGQLDKKLKQFRKKHGNIRKESQVLLDLARAIRSYTRDAAWKR